MINPMALRENVLIMEIMLTYKFEGSERKGLGTLLPL